MESYVKSKVPVAVENKSKFDLSCQHLTTSGFMEFSPVLVRELTPKSSVDITHKSFCRTLPLDKPVLGSVRMHNRAFFVPFRTVFEPFSDFIVDSPHNVGGSLDIMSNVPVVSIESLCMLLTRFATEVQSVEEADFSYRTVYYKLTVYGRVIYKQLLSLGYKIFEQSNKQFVVSALPILCLAKVYLDWYYPSQYANILQYATIEGYFLRQQTYELTTDELTNIFSCIMYVAYDNDFFTSAWDNPIGPANATGSTDFNIKDLTFGAPIHTSTTSSSINHVVGQSVTQNTNGTPLLVGYPGNSNGDIGSSYYAYSFPSQYSLDTLKALTSYVRRHQLSGSRALDRMLSSWGVLLDADKLKRSYYLGHDDFPIEIGDVFSTAETDGASLGAYSGKGIAYSEFKFDTSVDEFGMLFVINSIVPDVEYVQGIDRNLYHVSKLDFLTGEFDGLGPQAIATAELVTSPLNSSFTTDIDKTFGFAPRYYEYKIPYSRMTGDFTLNSRNTDMLGWSTARLFDTAVGSDELYVHGITFVIPTQPWQYNRIFLSNPINDDSQDGFIIVHRDDFTLHANMRPLYELPEWDDEKHKQQVTNDVNGVKMN